MRTMRRFGWLTAAVVLASATAAWAQDAVAVLTEIQTRKGQVQVKTSSDADWVVPKPLQALRAGDQVRATADARAVLVFTGGRGTQQITQGNSPFKVDVKGEGAVTDRAKAVVGNVTNFLLGQQRDMTRQSLSVRSMPPPTILAPSETLVTADSPPAIEWAGSASGGFTVRILGPQGSVWQQTNVPRPPLAYAGPPLVPGTKYTLELQWTQPQPVKPDSLRVEKGTVCAPPSDKQIVCTQRKPFEVLGAERARRVREQLAVLTPESVSGSTLVLMRAGLLVQERLYADARRELMAGITQYPQEATLHQLLGYVYDRTGPERLAINEFDEAEALMSGR